MSHPQPQQIELRPNTDLLNPQFDGYKLALTPITTIADRFNVQVDRLLPTSSQYSMLQAKLFAMHNHLVGECDTTESVYYIDKAFCLHKYFISETTGKFQSHILWRIPTNRGREMRDYNITLKLASDKLAVVSDGMGLLYVLDRGDRHENPTWQVVFSSEVVPDRSFMISEARFHDKKLHVLLTSIREEDGTTVTVINWVVLLEDPDWVQTALRELVVPGHVPYLSLDGQCTAVDVISEAGCKFVYDSDKRVQDDCCATKPTANQRVPDDDQQASAATGATFNSEQVEECDFESDKLSTFERLDAATHHVTHQVNLGTHQVLLTLETSVGEPLAFGIRTDVDCCIYQPNKEKNFTLVHRGTLLALAYIQASKQQRKYFVCAPNMSYSVICESSKHVFIYRQNKPIVGGELRNRTSGQKVVGTAQQQVYKQSTPDEVIGIYASNYNVYILSQNCITALKL